MVDANESVKSEFMFWITSVTERGIPRACIMVDDQDTATYMQTLLKIMGHKHVGLVKRINPANASSSA